MTIPVTLWKSRTLFYGGSGSTNSGTLLSLEMFISFLVVKHQHFMSKIKETTFNLLKHFVLELVVQSL